MCYPSARTYLANLNYTKQEYITKSFYSRLNLQQSFQDKGYQLNILISGARELLHELFWEKPISGNRRPSEPRNQRLFALQTSPYIQS